MTVGYHEKLLKEPVCRARLCRLGCHDVVYENLKSDDIAAHWNGKNKHS